MKRMLITLTALALMITHASAATEVEFIQAAYKVQELVTEAKKVGLSQEEALSLIAQGLETSVLEEDVQLMAEQKRTLLYVGIGVAAIVLIGGGIWLAYKNGWLGGRDTQSSNPTSGATEPTRVVWEPDASDPNTLHAKVILTPEEERQQQQLAQERQQQKQRAQQQMRELQLRQQQERQQMDAELQQQAQESNRRLQQIDQAVQQMGQQSRQELRQIYQQHKQDIQRLDQEFDQQREEEHRERQQLFEQVKQGNWTEVDRLRQQMEQRSKQGLERLQQVVETTKK